MDSRQHPWEEFRLDCRWSLAASATAHWRASMLPVMGISAAHRHVTYPVDYPETDREPMRAKSCSGYPERSMRSGDQCVDRGIRRLGLLFEARPGCDGQADASYRRWLPSRPSTTNELTHRGRRHLPQGPQGDAIGWIVFGERVARNPLPNAEVDRLVTSVHRSNTRNDRIQRGAGWLKRRGEWEAGTQCAERLAPGWQMWRVPPRDDKRGFTEPRPRRDGCVRDRRRWCWVRWASRCRSR